jgi:signal transduction histidine kinase
MKVRPERTARFELIQLVLMVAVLASFVADSLVDMRASSHMARRVSDMSDNAMPSIQALTQALGAVHAIEDEVRAPAMDTFVPGGRLARHRQGLTFDLATYYSLPTFPGELDLHVTVAEAKLQFDRALDDMLAAVASGNAAPRAAVDRVVRLGDSLDLVLDHTIDFNAVQGERVGAEVHGMDERSRARRVVVDTFVTLLAILVTAFSVITWRRAAIAQQKRAAELDAFAGRVAHDLRNPLGALSMRLALMQTRDVTEPEKVRDHVGKAIRQVGRLNITIDALLEFARAAANPPPGAHAELHEALDRVVDELRAPAQGARAELTVDAFSSPLEVACTPGALASVLSNLIGNAVKYITEGRRPLRQIHVHVEAVENIVRVEVEDTGPGLSSEAQSRAFQPFVRLTATAQPGIGLGLATVKRIVEAFGGRVGVRSALGEGSTFWFEMPKAPRAA